MGFDQLRGQHICDGNRADAAPGLSPAISHSRDRPGSARGPREVAQSQKGQEWETTQKQHQEMLQLWQGGVQGEPLKRHVPKAPCRAMGRSRAQQGFGPPQSPAGVPQHHQHFNHKIPEPQCPKESSCCTEGIRADSSGPGCPGVQERQQHSHCP